MTSALGVYWSVMHRRPQDYAYFKQLQPSVFKIMDGGPPDYQWARDNLPDSLIIARDWALSEQHADMLKDPKGCGQRHAQEWDRHQKTLGFDRAKTLILGINEPRIWDAGVSEALRLYTIAFCDTAKTFGLRVGAMQLSVGWPNNDGPDTLPNWSAWHDVDNAIRHNNGALVCHEYWADNGPAENWGWWAGRVLKCPWQVPIVIGECGIDMYVKDGSVGQQQRGWRGHKSAEEYAHELADYVGRMSADSRFVGCAVFAADFAHNEWASFDIEPAYKAILATPIPVAPSSTPVDTHIPNVGTGAGPQPAPATSIYVTAASGLNLRAEPVTGKVLTALPYGTRVDSLGGPRGSWWPVRYGDLTGWVHSAFTSSEPPTSAPEQPGDNFRRCLDFVLRWEGLWADDHRDVGAATMKGITIGTYAKWREAHGQPKPSKEDLRAISDGEVEQIYREWYWQASGADGLHWPLCLAHFDTAVNAGIGRSTEMLTKSGGNFLAYMGHLLTWYAKIDGFDHFGRAWTRRRADLLLEASK